VGCNPKEEKGMIDLFNIKIYMKCNKVVCLFDLGSQTYMICTQLVEKLGI